MCAANMQMIRVPNYVHELVCHLISCNTCCPDMQTRRQKGTIHVCLYCRYVYVCACVYVVPGYVHELMCQVILWCQVSQWFTWQCCRDSWVIICTNMTQHNSVAQIHITLSHKRVQRIHIKLSHNSVAKIHIKLLQRCRVSLQHRYVHKHLWARTSRHIRVFNGICRI